MAGLEPVSVVPPTNFSIVEAGIYRSGLPTPSNFEYLKTLNLKSVICLFPEPYPKENFEFLLWNNIKLYQFGVQGTKEPVGEVSNETIIEGLKVLLDPINHPVLVHCNGGKHRTGCLVGCFRRVQNWDLVDVFEEYKRFAGAKFRVTDMKFIEAFDACQVGHWYSVIYRCPGCVYDDWRMGYLDYQETLLPKDISIF